MASPVTLYIAPDTGVEVKVDLDSVSSTRSSYMFPGDIIRGYSYQLSNLGQFRLKKNDQLNQSLFSRGFMSPIAPVTLPSYARKLCGILEPARTFAFLHPPIGLAGQIDWNYYSSSCHEEDDSFVDNDSGFQESKRKTDNGIPDTSWAIPYLSVTGAFIYFDDDLNVVSVNVLTFQPTEFALNLSGSYNTPQPVVTSIIETKRAQVISLDAFHECSFVAMSWVRPYETFGGILPSGEHHDNRHGT
jgi:hypothetical protein